ncbi:ROK family protein [Paenarthrobacter sp. RAF54_2]|uniref:ROK family protein n=1 Tax=Paenarthrobacter sp. RAF54_2 TaxID=3233061 RepID=UPI003F9726D2
MTGAGLPLPRNPAPTPVLEIGGTHVTAALVMARPHLSTSWRVVSGSITRRSLHAGSSADDLLDALAAAANSLGRDHARLWGIALPGPFDYATGMGMYRDVGKFDQLRGVNVGSELAARFDHPHDGMAFLNDADAFGIGAFALSRGDAARGMAERAVCITLGTGIGSTFLQGGLPVKAGHLVPLGGNCYNLSFQGRPLEDTASRRAIRWAYAEATGSLGTEPPDVHAIAQLSRKGDTVASRVLERAFAAVGTATGPYLRKFGAQELMVGGSMAGSWDIVEPALRSGITSAVPALRRLLITNAEHFEEASLAGAAIWVNRIT